MLTLDTAHNLLVGSSEWLTPNIWRNEMGNRAVITTGKGKENVGIYVNWNGGPESVLAFLEVARRRGFRCPGMDKSYAMARLTGIIHEFFKCGLSVGIGTLDELDTDNGDNGVYEIGENWDIIDRWGVGHNSIKNIDELSKEQMDKYYSIVKSWRNLN